MKTYTIKRITIGSDDDDLTPQAISSLPSLYIQSDDTLLEIIQQFEKQSPDFEGGYVTGHLTEFTELDADTGYYEPAYEAGYKTYGSYSDLDENEFNEIIYLVKEAA